MSLVALAGAVEDLVLVAVGDDIDEALGLRDRLDAKIGEALSDFDATWGWGVDGSLSLSSWLTAHGRRSRRDAHLEATVAVRLARLTVTAQAWADGTLSSGQVAAIVANVSARRAGLYAGHEAHMTPVLAELSVADVARVMRSWALNAEASEDGPEGREAASELRLSPTLDGRRVLGGHLRAEDAAVVEAALASALAPRPGPGEGPAPAMAERRAESLVEVCRWYLAHGDQPSSGPRARPQVSVIVDISDLAGEGPGHLADGTAVAASTVLRLACDCVLHRVVMAGRSTVLDYGSAVRTISPALWAALVIRDTHCRHPGCDRPPMWSEAHHVKHFARGGPTCLSNLVMACSRHHHLWHDQGWHLELSDDATLTVTSPWGTVLTSRPPPVRLVA